MKGRVNFRLLLVFFSSLILGGCTIVLSPPVATASAPQELEEGVTVDNGSPAAELTGNWKVVKSSSAYDGTCAWAPFWENPADGALDPLFYASATFKPRLPQSGFYEVYTWWCNAHARDLSTKQLIWLCASRGFSCTSIYINPQESSGRWNSLGIYYMDKDGDVTVRNGTTRLGALPGQETIADGAVVIDAFRFVFHSPPVATLTPPPFRPQPSPTP